MRHLGFGLLAAVMLVSSPGVAETGDWAQQQEQLRAAEAAARADAAVAGIDTALAAYYAGSYTEALAQLTALADEGNVEAMFWLGAAYESGEGIPLDPIQAARWFEAAVDEDDFAPAQYRLAVLYDSGRGVEKDAERAIELYAAAAEQGHVDAQRNLAYAYERGWGTDKDPVKAFRWYQRAGDQGDPDGLDGARRVAAQPLPDDAEWSELEQAIVYYYQGDAFRAVSGFTALADEGDAEAKAWLGYMCELGDGTPRNLDRAAGLYEAAADDDDPRGLIGLATFYYLGEPMAEDRAKAAGLFEQAAEMGSVLAQYNLGYMYENGYGVAQDKTLAVRWYRLAAMLGYDVAADDLKRLAR